MLYCKYPRILESIDIHKKRWKVPEKTQIYEIAVPNLNTCLSIFEQIFNKTFDILSQLHLILLKWGWMSKDHVNVEAAKITIFIFLHIWEGRRDFWIYNISLWRYQNRILMISLSTSTWTVHKSQLLKPATLSTLPIFWNFTEFAKGALVRLKG